MAMVSKDGCFRSGLLVLLTSLVLGCSPADEDPDASAATNGDSVTSGETTPAQDERAALDFLYQTDVGGGLGVFVSVAGDVTRVDEGAPGLRHKHPIWTNDGSQVAFVAEGEWDAAGEVTRPSEVWVVGPSGEKPHALIRCRCGDLNNPAWSPDGKTVAFVEFDGPIGLGPPERSRIMTLSLDSGKRMMVASSMPGQLLDIPRWSPDGSRLVVSIDRFDEMGNESGSSFGVVPAGGGSVQPLLPFEDYAYAADWGWATDTIVFSVESQEFASPNPEVSPWNLFSIQADGSDRHVITDVGSDAGLSLPMWSADGALIAATLDTTLDSPGGQMAVVVNAETGEITPLADPVSDYARLRPTQ